jgi:hypothetical protein
MKSNLLKRASDSCFCFTHRREKLFSPDKSVHSIKSRLISQGLDIIKVMLMIIYSTCSAFHCSAFEQDEFYVLRYSIHACILEWSGVLTKIDRMKNSLTLHNHEKRKNGKMKYEKMFAPKFREVTCDLAFSLPSPPKCEKKRQNLAGTKESTCSHLQQDNQMKHIIRFEYHKKIIFNIIANITTTKAEEVKSS